MPKQPVSAPDEMSDEALLDFAHALKHATKRLDALFGNKTPLVLWCALAAQGL